MKAIRLRTEYLYNPIGIDIVKPRLFWSCEGGVTQTAYQITAECDGKNIWDSGKTKSSRMTHIPYGGSLTSRNRIEWRVRLWDENDIEGEWSECAVFEMGLLNASDWRAQWITGNYKPDKKRRYPVDCFRKAFNAQKIVKARLYAAACGIYEGCLNGKRIGNFVLAPGHTDYRKRIQYQTYDVTDLLLDGENRFIIAPKPGGHFTHAELSYQSVYGKVGCRWEKQSDKYVYNITVPANTTAAMTLPHGTVQTLTAGTYIFEEAL